LAKRASERANRSTARTLYKIQHALPPCSDHVAKNTCPLSRLGAAAVAADKLILSASLLMKVDPRMSSVSALLLSLSSPVSRSALESGVIDEALRRWRLLPVGLVASGMLTGLERLDAGDWVEAADKRIAAAGTRPFGWTALTASGCLKIPLLLLFVSVRR
jgi:hypothetical protein